MISNAKVAYPFESFNARYLNPSQVASSFVPPSQYEQLVKHRHTVVVGPRGSGKTTLLKMLQGEALEAWQHPSANEYRNKINYTGVFIPADRSWKDQIDALSNKKFSAEHRSLFSVASFTTHVLRSFISAIIYRVHPPQTKGLNLHRRVVLSSKQEALFVKKLSDSWLLSSHVPSLTGLNFALATRLSKIKMLSSQESSLDEKDRGHRLANEKILHLSFLDCIVEAMDLFEDISRERNAKWALLFDELEIVPELIRETVIRSMRSVDQRILFKLSLSPFNTDIKTSVDSVMPSHDYDVLPLWYPRKEDSYPFCRELLSLMLKARGINENSSDTIFGPSEFDPPKRDRKNHVPDYSPGSKQHARIISLSKKDKSFNRYLQNLKIDLNQLHIIKDSERASDIRKIISIVIVRDEFRKADNSNEILNVKNGKLRSRKGIHVYGGVKSLFAITEGNPRLFIGMVDHLLDQRQPNNKVPLSIQTAEIENAERRFRAFLKTIPCAPLKGRQPTRGVLTLIDIIGKAFLKRVIKDEFTPEPKGSFIVDSRTPPDLLESLGQALNAGALVYVPDQESDIVINSAKGKRFRLSFLLAPNYYLPLTLLRPIDLSSLLPSSVVGKKTNCIQKSFLNNV